MSIGRLFSVLMMTYLLTGCSLAVDVPRQQFESASRDESAGKTREVAARDIVSGINVHTLAPVPTNDRTPLCAMTVAQPDSGPPTTTIVILAGVGLILLFLALDHGWLF